MSTPISTAPRTVTHHSVSGVVEYLFEQYPYVARLAGRHDYDGRLPDVVPRSPADFAELRTALEHGLARLPEGSDPEVRADLDTALRVLEHERFRIERLGQVHQGVMDWVYEMDISLYLDPEYAPVGDRVTALRSHLATLPAFLARAASTLDARQPAGGRIRAIEVARAQAAYIVEAVAAFSREHPRLASSALTDAAAAAAAACEEYARAVETTTPDKGLYGSDLLAELLSTTEGVETPPADLIDEVEAEVASTEAAIASVTARLGASSRRDAYDLMTVEVGSGSVMESLTSITERLRQFWAQQDVLSLDLTTPLKIECSRANSRAAMIQLAIAPRSEGFTRSHVLRAPEPARPDGRPSAGSLWEYLNDPMLEMLAVHEAYAGHYVQVEAARQGPSLIRSSIFWFPGFTEGWAHYVEELAIERGLSEGRPLIELAQLRFALESATRLLTFLSVHTGRWTFAEACERVESLCDWSVRRVAKELLEAVMNGRRAMYTLGKLRVRQWRREAAVASGRDLKAFHDRLMRCGTAPLSTVHRYCLDAAVWWRERSVPAG